MTKTVENRQDNVVVLFPGAAVSKNASTAGSTAGTSAEVLSFPTLKAESSQATDAQDKRRGLGRGLQSLHDECANLDHEKLLNRLGQDIQARA